MNTDTMLDASSIKDFNHNPIDEDSTFTSIVILTYNQLEYTKLCIESIRKFTLKDSYEIIVVDNNSSDDTPNWLKLQSDLKVIFNSENKGFPIGCNQGIEISIGKNILLLNNDTIVTPNWLQNLKKALYSCDDIGVVGPVSNSCSNSQQIITTYSNSLEMLDFSSKYNISNKSQWKLKPKLIGFCYLIKKEVIDKVGLLDEIFTPGNFEDDDFSYRVLCSGYKLLLCEDTFIHHFGSTSFGKNSKTFIDTYIKNSRKFKEKWGFASESISFFKPEILNLIQENPDNKLNILQIECGIGSSLLELKNRYKNATLYGTSKHNFFEKIASNICNFSSLDIEIDELPYCENLFDYIIFDDILEHLQNPWLVIYNIRKYLKQGGYIIVNIPNIMHISIVSQLLKGSFSYQNTGILDKSNLRFFTLAEIDKLFINNDYNIALKTASITQISTEDNLLINKLCSSYGEELRPQYTAYQYIIKASPNLDMQIFEQNDILELRKALLNIDCKKDIETSLNIIYEFYENNPSSFNFYINYLINNTMFNKDYILNQINLKIN